MATAGVAGVAAIFGGSAMVFDGEVDGAAGLFII